jgi:mannose-6-phosphate isomerase-like protein (cupin superfamily)
VDKANLERLPSFITADGSAIRELAGRAGTGADARHQSLAEATLEPGGETAEHFHPQAEELYYFVGGEGRMRLGDQEAEIGLGDCVMIAPGTPHKLWNTGPGQLVLLCCCAPGYSDDDTVMTGR